MFKLQHEGWGVTSGDVIGFYFINSLTSESGVWRSVEHPVSRGTEYSFLLHNTLTTRCYPNREISRWSAKNTHCAKSGPSPCAVLADPAKLSRRRSRLGLRMRMGASRTCRRPAPSGHPPGSQVRGRDALRTLFRAAPALSMAVVRRDHLLFAPQVHNQGLATSVSIMVKPMGQKWRERPS